MSPIDKIKKGILDNDMQQVTEGFKLLTGQEVSPKETTVGDLELLEDETPAEEVVELADLVTEMKEIKHPFKSGIKAKKGIDF